MFCRLLLSARGILALAAIVAANFGPRLHAEDKIVFNRDVRPILADHCFACHGPDKAKRKAKLRLDERASAVEKRAIVPGKPDESELVARIGSSDPEVAMPPPDAHKPLSAGQKVVLKRWVAEGAAYQGHWAYEPPARPAVPEIRNPKHDIRNPIDALVLTKLQTVGVERAPEADRRTLARRLSFDLRGLPPTPAEVDAFIGDRSSDAYARLVERLLASPHYGERMAIGWLDVVRFADTIGYHSDNPRNVWPYRDYVIRSFNANMPFDQFTIEQLAGDLLPNAMLEQKIASCFNHLLLTTEEGGAQPKDYEARMLADRVRAVGTVWLGQTLGCCQCHDHKFDPIKTRDFYALGAFFADIREPIIGRRDPGMPMPDERQARELARLQAALADVKQRRDHPPPVMLAGRTALGAAARSLTEWKLGRIAGAAGQVAWEVVASFETAAAQKALTVYESALPHCLVSVSLPTPRTVRVLPRGNWMDDSGEVVRAALPGYLSRLPEPDGPRRTRLDLANWLVSRGNPLTARTLVNRLWRQFFGSGLCKTLDDLGTQGEWPVHAELLDWLAVEFMDSGWDVKHLVRTIVLSRTYRQAAGGKDAENRLLARQSRFRLDAELVRDNALAVAGLLSLPIGGPSARPYQPAGYWENLNFPLREYAADVGSSQYRRGLYAWWQRSFPHPSLIAFDAPSREECTAERPRSNIPQQALVLLNDPTYVEAARVFAVRIIREGGAGTATRTQWAWSQALQRLPRADEVATIAALVDKHRHEYERDRPAADALLHVGLAPVPNDIDAAELAAWTSAARVILNLHETVTRP